MNFDDIIVEVDLMIVKLNKVVNIMTENKRTVVTLMRVIPTYTHETILSIPTHKALLQHFLLAECKHFSCIGDAIEAVTEHDILMYISEIHLYGVFTALEYLLFMQNFYRDNDIYLYTPKQVIISKFSQKVVFICTGDKQFMDKIIYYSEVYFRSKILSIVNGNTTTIIVQSAIVNNLEESRVLFVKFFSFVNENEKVSSFQLNQEVYRVNNISYMSSTLISEDNKEYLKNCRLEDLLTMLGSSHQTVKEPSEKDRVKDWIRKNPPNHCEKKTDYYEKYKKDTNAPVAESTFGKIMKEFGYNTKKTSKSREWIRR